jgi:8-oxo-dGTP diphosphatase
VAQSSPRHSVSVAAAIRNQAGQLLAVRRRDNGHWEPPGGVLELEETIQAGLVREVLEETGLQVEPEALSGVYKNMRRGIIALVFRCCIVSGEPHPTSEADEVAWLTPTQVRELMDEAYATRLLDALDPGSVAIRAHDGLSLLPPSHSSSAETVDRLQQVWTAEDWGRAYGR